MKNIVVIAFCFASIIGTIKTNAQASELEQLALNVEKLAQFKQILSDLKKGYQILVTGYNNIKDISKGNFELHKVFLDGLLSVNPTISKYSKVADIVRFQVQLLSEYRYYYHRFKSSNLLQLSEVGYIGKVYGHLIKQSLNNLEDLAVVITSNTLRMNDEERIRAIDAIYDDMQDKLSFFRSFNNSNAMLILQRTKEKREITNISQYYK